MSWFKFECALIFVLLVLSPLLGTFPYIIEVPFRLLMGWLVFLWTNAQRVTPNAGLIASFAIALLIAAIVMHRIIAWARTGWRWQSTAAISVLVLVLFAASIAGTGIGHQFAWLPREPWIEEWSRGTQMMAMNNARQLQLSCQSYADTHDGAFPANLSELVLYQVDTEEDLAALRVWRKARTGEPEQLIYLGAGLKATDPGTLPLIIAPRAFAKTKKSLDGKWLVVDLAGGVEIVTQTEIDRALLELKELKAKRATSVDQK